ncbi:rRNA processing/ribosome biogenesis-domain-containing protein [Nemania sp. FL0916]|nr:rRNA processing/ribosome biogenesis-domain-containing protein [Nemania sp. FL0916]
MALVSLPPELRSICRRLASTKTEQLPPLLPILLKEIGRCQESLSRPQDPKSSDASPEAAALVHKLKTHINTLLNGRTSQGHFVGAALVKAVVDNGGWECLQTADAWVRGLIAIIKKKDPAVTKDLCIVTLTKIYTLMHEYPTLVREIVTPTLPDFVNACLQILKPPTSSKAGKAPHNLVETIFEALSTLVPLHPTTLRQFTGKLRSELRHFLAPTISDNALIPITLQESSRRLAVRLHMTAAKGSDATEWTKHVEELVKTLHSTSDHVFRAVQETWESAIGYKPQRANIDAEPRGGSEQLDQFPVWVGVQAGGERMIGLLEFVKEYLNCRTRVAVTIPITALVDITSRIYAISPPSPGKGNHGSEMNPAIGREERDELWAIFPDVQLAAMRLQLTLIRRLGKNYVPIAQENLDQIVRILPSLYRLPQARTMIFILVKEILQLCGPTLSKFTVESLTLVIKCCCRDLLGAAGCLPKPKSQGSSTSQNGQKSKTISQNADAFVPGKSQDTMMSVSLSAEHLEAGETLLTTLFTQLPQQYIPSSLRSQMLRTAILSRNKDAQVASILHTARDRAGRTPQVILPYLAQQFPQDQSVELLRFNFRPIVIGPPGEFMDKDDDMIIEEEEDGNAQPESTANGFSFGQVSDIQLPSAFTAPAPTAQFGTPSSSSIPTRSAEPVQNAFLAGPSKLSVQTSVETSVIESPSTQTSSLKRKNEDVAAETNLSKRIEIDMTRTSTTATTSSTDPATSEPPSKTPLFFHGAFPLPNEGFERGENESSDDESVHLKMELDSDSDDNDEDEDEDEE